MSPTSGETFHAENIGSRRLLGTRSGVVAHPVRMAYTVSDRQFYPPAPWPLRFLPLSEDAGLCTTLLSPARGRSCGTFDISNPTMRIRASEITSVLQRHRLVPGRQGHLRSHMDFLQLSGLGFGTLQYGAEMSVEVTGLTDYHVILFCLNGRRDPDT